MSELWCVICEKFVDAENMIQVTEWFGQSSASRATFLDGTVAHIVFSEKHSARLKKKMIQPEPKSEPVVVQVKLEPVNAPAPTASTPQTRFDELFTTQVQEAQQPEGWSPLPDEWFAAIVSAVHDGYTFASLSNGEEVYISAATVIEEQGHSCLHVGDEVALTLTRNKEDMGSKWAATQCSLQTPREVSVVERGRVARWGEKSGFVQLDCGCRRKVVLRAPAFFNDGDRVEVSEMVPDWKNSGRVMATNIEAIPEEEDNEQ